MASRKPMRNDQTALPFGALQLLAPPLRLVSAALWKVMKDRDVMQYGNVEEFVTSACDTVPGLLTLRHQARLTLGLRARLVFELCRENPDPAIIAVHMKRIRVPALPSSFSSVNVEREYKIKSAVENTHALVPKLLTDPAEREHFFKEVFPVVYGTNFDQELEKLLWEFLIRLDQLLPVPSLAQTVSWIKDAPLVLEECARAASQPQLLKILLNHQTCLGHLDPAASLPPNMGDSIITSLSLPPSGIAPSDVPGPPSESARPFVKPVIGLISNDNVPLMVSLSQRLPSSETTNASRENSDSLLKTGRPAGVKEGNKVNESSGVSGMKRKHGDNDSTSDEENILRKVKSVKRTTTGNVVQRSEEPDAEDNREMLQACLLNNGYEKIKLPKDDFLCSVWVSCLKNCPKVVIEGLSLTSACDDDSNPPKTRSNPLGKSALTKSHRTSALFSGSHNKENTPTRRSALRQKRSAERRDSPSGREEYVTDSEDEASRNFKRRLFTKRYCKTKHGTYVPTLREFWRPCAERRNLTGPSSKRR